MNKDKQYLTKLINASSKLIADSNKLCLELNYELDAVIDWMETITNVISKNEINERILEGRSREFEKTQWALEILERIRDKLNAFEQNL